MLIVPGLVIRPILPPFADEHTRFIMATSKTFQQMMMNATGILNNTIQNTIWNTCKKHRGEKYKSPCS